MKCPKCNIKLGKRKMEKIIFYYCNICGAGYDTYEKASDCEKSHINKGGIDE